MSRILKAQDIHTNPAWIEESKKHIARICEVAIEQKVDAITIAGDFFHKPVMASDKNNWDDILQMARDLQNAAPVYYVHGTPSHDSPGTYSSFKDIGWKEVTIGQSYNLGDLLIMGIPEITPAFLTARFPELSKTDIVAKQYELVNDVIDSYYSPLASSACCPVLFMGHGHIAGTKFRDDQKPRSSDFMYSEEMLNRIGADHIQFGHIHLPQKYYGGSAHITWGDLGFKPGFDVWDSSSDENERFDYGELERQKITINTDDFGLGSKFIVPTDKSVNVWIDVLCDKEFSDNFKKEDIPGLLEFSGPLSKITFNIQHVEHTRIDSEEYEACNTTEDLYKIYDPEATESILLKVREAEENTETESISSEVMNFGFPDVYLKGTKAGRESGIDEIHITPESFQTGANLITGPNGKGKSFSLGFCTPFSVHLPDGIDLKSLFELKDSQIIRKFPFNGGVITQKILIDPTLSNPTAKFFMDINGEPVANVTGNKAPFDEAVENIFGSIKMFMTCAFRGQKENEKYPSLENAKETDLRKIFTELSGTDRSQMKQYAHDKAVSGKRDIELDSRELITIQSSLEDVEELKHSISGNKVLQNNLLKDKKTCDKESENLNVRLNKINDLVNYNAGIETQVSTLNSEAQNLTNSVSLNGFRLREISSTLENADATKKELKDLQEKQSKYTEASNKYFNAQGEFNKSVDVWNKNKDAIDQDLETIRVEAEDIKTLIDTINHDIVKNEGLINVKKSAIESANDPCEHCKKISTSAQEKIDRMNSDITECESKISGYKEKVLELEKKLDSEREKYRSLKDSISKPPEAPEDLINLKSSMESLKPDLEKLRSLESIVSGLKQDEEKKSELERSIEKENSRIKEITLIINQLNANKNKVDFEELSGIKTRIKEIADRVNEISSENGRITAENNSLANRIDQNDKRLSNIKAIETRLSSAQSNITEWEKVESAFSPKGIPAMELSLIAPIIDREANRLLNSYGTRFKIQTITQDLDSRGNLSEKFKILVHDSQASEVKNLPVVSGGQGVWITKALQESIAKVASNRTGRNWMYSIMDEADAALDTDIIADFYSMMDRAMDGKRILVSVTHSSEAKAAISNIIEITDFFVKGEE